MNIILPETAFQNNPCNEIPSNWIHINYGNRREETSTQASRYLDAMKLPRSLLPWKNKRETLNAMVYQGTAFLFDPTSVSGMHLINNDGYGGYTIMEDSDRELKRHLNAVFNAKGRILKTGLGLGCFVRACLENPAVEHIDVIELSPDIADHFGSPFKDDPRVTIHVADALTFDLSNYPKKHWDLAWHDIYCDGNDGLTKLHSSLIKKFAKYAKLQGAWDLPRWARRLANRDGRRRLL